jgi:hypothetical protein
MFTTVSPPSSAGLTATSQVFVYVTAGFVVAAGGWFSRAVLKHQAQRTRDLKEKDEQRTKDMKEVKEAVAEVRSALITDAPTPFNPFPQKKLVDRFNELWDSHFALKRVVERMDVRVSDVKTDTTALVHDSTTNKGHSMRDAMDRVEANVGDIQTEQGRVREQLDEKERT